MVETWPLGEDRLRMRVPSSQRIRSRFPWQYEIAVNTRQHQQSIRVESKHFMFDLKANPRGNFLRITEEVNGRYDAIVIPMSGLEQFRAALDEVIKLSQTTFPKE
jgi:hypothetical protein